MKYLFSLITFFFTLNTIAQAPTLEWQRRFGGTDEDHTTEAKQTPDGGYIVLGRTYSNDGDMTNNHGDSDIWVAKLSATGTVEWKKNYGGSQHDSASSMELTSDSGYIITGFTFSNDGDVNGNHGNYDGWVLKINAVGTVEWQKTYGGSNGDVLNTISKTSDNGYILAGASFSNDGDTVSNLGNYDAWLLKINASGTVQWKRNYGGTQSDYFWKVIESDDGGYIITGETSSDDGTIVGQHGSYDAWILKVDATGTPQWQKILGGLGYDTLRSITTTSDNHIIVSGYSASNEGDVTNNHGNSDSWVIKLNSSGTLLWNKLFGGTEDEGLGNVIEDSDGNYVIASTTHSNNGDVTQNNGDNDGWLFKLNPAGTLLWQKSFGSNHQEIFYDIQKTSDNGYIIAGSIFPLDSEPVTYGGSDLQITKLTPDNLSLNDVTLNKKTKIYPIPMREHLIIETGAKDFTGTISDSNGKTVIPIQSNEILHTVNTSNLSEGVYFLELHTAEGNKCYKIIK